MPKNPNQPLAISGLPATLRQPQAVAVLDEAFSRRGLAFAWDGAVLVISIAHPPVDAKEVLTKSSNPQGDTLTPVRLALREALAELADIAALEQHNG